MYQIRHIVIPSVTTFPFAPSTASVRSSDVGQVLTCPKHLQRGIATTGKRRDAAGKRGYSGYSAIRVLLSVPPPVTYVLLQDRTFRGGPARGIQSTDMFMEIYRTHDTWLLLSDLREKIYGRAASRDDATFTDRSFGKPTRYRVDAPEEILII